MNGATYGSEDTEVSLSWEETHMSFREVKLLTSFASNGNSVHFSSVAQSYSTLCNPKGCSMPGLPVHHQLSELAQTHVHWVRDAIQSSYPLSSPSPPAFNLSQHQGLFQWVSSFHQVAKVLEFQLQHQSFTIITFLVVICDPQWSSVLLADISNIGYFLAINYYY